MQPSHKNGAAPEIWGGAECSNVRVGEGWRDQLRETGHHERLVEDIARVAALGIRTMRVPVLWERAAPGQLGACGWGWHDRQFAVLAQHGIAALAGLVHHGSGPRGTDLLDPDFAPRLARHAARAAARYEVWGWVPVNEPLTTARFSCLYGHWYPHLRDEAACFRATVNQCRASLLAMRAIRAHQPAARFVHTEDVGRVFSTAKLAGQARYENDRRWLSLDLLCGRLDRAHPLWDRLLDAGADAAHLDELATGEAAPDLLGINHYATSDRFLDHRIGLYSPALRGGNGWQTYADTEALRVDLGPELTGLAPRLREVWARYGRPIVVSEAHLGCVEQEEQLRWLMECWAAALSLREEGADVRAVTAWALFGLVDWDSMLRERRGRIEPGVFDVAAGLPRPTLLAQAVAGLARDGRFDHAALDMPGWWRRAERVHATLRRA